MQRLERSFPRLGDLWSAMKPVMRAHTCTRSPCHSPTPHIGSGVRSHLQVVCTLNPKLRLHPAQHPHWSVQQEAVQVHASCRGQQNQQSHDQISSDLLGEWLTSSIGHFTEKLGQSKKLSWLHDDLREVQQNLTLSLLCLSPGQRVP